MRALLGLLMLVGAVTCTDVKVKGPLVVSHPPSHYPSDSVGLLSGLRGLLLGKNAFLFQRPLLVLSKVAKAVGEGADHLAAKVTNAGLSGLGAASQSLAEPYKKPYPLPLEKPVVVVEKPVLVAKPVVVEKPVLVEKPVVVLLDKGAVKGHHDTHHRTKGHHVKGHHHRR